MCYEGRETKRNDIMYEGRRKNCECLIKKNRKEKGIKEGGECTNFYIMNERN